MRREELAARRLAIVCQVFACITVLLGTCPSQAQDKSEIDAVLLEGSTLADSGKHREALECFLRGIQSHPENHQLWNNIGVTYRHLGQLDQSIGALQRSVKICPESVTNWQNLAISHFQAKRLQESLDCNLTLIELDPDGIDAHMNAAELYFLMHQMDKAWRYTESASGVDKSHPRLLLIRGRLLSSEGKYPKAVEQYTKYLELQPDSVIALGERGLIRVAQREDEAAEKDFQRAIELDPSCRSKYVQIAAQIREGLARYKD